MIINNSFINVNVFNAKNENKLNLTLIIIHGIAEYSVRYEDTANFFVSKGINVITLDLRGHGKSYGDRGKLDNLDDVLDDIYQIVQLHKKNNEIFILGHSLGGTIATAYALKYKNIDGLIITSTSLDYMDSLKLYRFLPKFLIKRIKLKTNFYDPKLLMNKANIKYELDLDFFYGSLVYEVLIKGIRRIKSNATSFNTPLLVVHSSIDKIVPLKNVLEYYNKLKLKDKKLYLVENSYHNILHDNEKEDIYNKITKWIVDHK